MQTSRPLGNGRAASVIFADYAARRIPAAGRLYRRRNLRQAEASPEADLRLRVHERTFHFIARDTRSPQSAMQNALKLVLAAGVLLLPACHHDASPDPCGGWNGLVAPNLSASVALTPPAGIITSPQMVTIAAGSRATFVALVTGFPPPECRDYALTVGWSVSDTSVARVERATGDSTVVLGIAVGSVSVIATVLAEPTAKAASLLQVVPASQTVARRSPR